MEFSCLKRAGMAAATLVASTVMVATTSSPAFAACRVPDGETQYYTFNSISATYSPTDLYSPAYLTGPGSITYSQSATATVSASMTATVSAEAGVVFAKASTSLGITVGASYSKSSTWSYTMQVPAGVTARMRLYHEMRTFKVAKYVWNNKTCKYAQRYNSQVTAPLRSDANQWRLES